MKTISINVQKEFCGECSLALMHFIGKMKGVGSVTAEDGRVVLSFDEAEIEEKTLLKIAVDNIEKMGYKVE